MPTKLKRSSNSATPRSVRSQRKSPKGERTLQHVVVPYHVALGLDTLHWMRCAAALGGKDMEPEKSALYDDAISAFLSRYERKAAPYPKRVSRQVSKSFWVSTRLVARCRTVALRDDIKMPRLMSFALTAFVESTVKPSWHEFRDEIARRAGELLNPGR